MKEVLAIIRPEKWQATKEAAAGLGAYETAHVRVLGRGRQRGLRYLRRVAADKGAPAREEVGGMQFLPKRMVTWFVPDAKAKRLVAAIIAINQTSNFGDGKIFVCPLDTMSDAESGGDGR